MLSQFKDKSSASLFWLIILSVLVHFHFLIVPPVIQVPAQYKILHALLQPLSALPDLLLMAVYQIIVLTQAVRLNYGLESLEMFPQGNMLAALCYILFTAFIPDFNNITGALIANSFLIGILPVLKSLHTKEKPEKLLFNLSFATGIGILLYPPLLPLAIMLFFAIFVLCNYRFNHLLVWILGLVLPFYFLAAILFLNDQLPSFYDYLPHFGHHFFPELLGRPYIIAYIGIGLTLLAGLAYKQANTVHITILARRCWGLLTFLLLLLIPVFYFIDDAGANSLTLCTVPIAAIAANAFYYPQRKWTKTLWFWLIFIAIIYNSWAAVFHFFL